MTEEQPKQEGDGSPAAPANIPAATTESTVAKVAEAPPTSQPQYISKSTPQEQIKESRIENFREFLTECRRVLRITRKPDRDEFRTIVKVSGLGMLIIGVIGFLVSFLKEVLF